MGLRSRLIDTSQVLLLRLSYALHREADVVQRRSSHVIGVEEVAGILHQMAEAYPEAVSVRCSGGSFYAHTYDHDLADVPTVLRLIQAPWLLGSLARHHTLFFYVGGAGFLVADRDGREREFAFLMSKGCQIVCIFTGSDIRAPALMDEFGRSHGRDVVTTYLPQLTPLADPAMRESAKKRSAAAADRHAAVIVNPPVDQMSYLERETHSFLYFCPDSRIGFRPQKWRNRAERLRVVHAPSSPILKGTPIVRAAVKELQEQGYDFDYVEISNRKHDEVLGILEDAHIVLNEFYALLPGVLGVEAMAFNAVLLTAADGALEPSLPPGANEAWVVTPYWSIRANLERALTGAFDLQAQADRGTEWVARFCSMTSCRDQLDELVAPLLAAKE